jgi:hypothetical protein
MISLEIGETMVELSLAALEASAGDRMGGQVDRRGEGEGGGERGGEGRGGEGKRGGGGVGGGGGGGGGVVGGWGRWSGRGGGEVGRWVSVAVVGGCSGKVEEGG